MSSRGSSALLGMAVRQYFAWVMLPIWRTLRFLQLPAAALTTLSVLLAGAAAVAVSVGRFALGGWLYVLSGLCDFFDGRLARESGSASPAGAALDSVLDRVCEGVMLVGLAWYYRETWLLPVIGLLMIGSFLVSYIRAKGEALGVEIKSVGLMQRPERIVYLGFAVALSPVLEALYVPGEAKPIHHLAVVVLIVITVSTSLTAASRLIYLMRALGDIGLQQPWRAVDAVSLRRFTFSSTMATAADFAVVVTLVGALDLPPWGATLVGCLAGAAINYTVANLWAFGAQRSVRLVGPRYGFASTTSALLNAGGVAVLMLLPALDYRLGWAVTRGAVFAFWSFPLNQRYILSHRAAAEPPRAADGVARVHEQAEPRG
jgi:phosphatidylglycerophosphate synthase/putative flippase GtrA